MVFGGYLGVTVLSLVTGPAPNRLRADLLRHRRDLAPAIAAGL